MRFHRFTSKLMTRSCLQLGSRNRALGLALAGLLACGALAAATAQDGKPDGQHELVQCASTISLEKRLVFEQWSLPDDCEKPTRTRVTDRFLGYTCVEVQSQVATCRAYIPGPDSRAFDTSGVFRCVDLGVTPSEDGVAVSRLREWAAPQKSCDWSLDLELLAMEVDFDNGQVCVAALCMPVDRLTVVGKWRLRLLIEKAFRELDLVGEMNGLRPVHAHPQ
jgi:hypothetical protein